MLCAIVSSWLLPAAPGQPAQEPRELTAPQKEKLKERDRLAEEVSRLRGAGSVKEAVEVMEKVLALEREILGSDNEDVAGSLLTLGELYAELEEYDAAQKSLEEALRIKKKLSGEKHWQALHAARLIEELRLRAKLPPETRALLKEADAACDQAYKHYAAEKYAEGVPFAEKALATYQRILGEESTDYATGLNNLGLLHHGMGAYAKAEPLLARALEIRKKALGEENPLIATSCNNLGLLYYATGDYARTESYYLQALEIWKKTLGKEHRDVATSLNNLGMLCYVMGDYARAETFHLQALEIKKKVFGEEHRDYAMSLNNLGLLYCAMAEYAKAEPFCTRAIAIQEKTLGEKSPLLAISLCNLATVSAALGDLARAESLYRRAERILRDALGPEHPYVAVVLNDLAELYIAMGDYARAEPLFKQDLEITRKALGEKHPEFATTLNNLGNLYGRMGDYDRAEALYSQALTIVKGALGEENPLVATCLHNLASLYSSMGNYARAEPLLVQALALTKKAIGEENRDVAFTLHNLGLLYASMGEDARAEAYFVQALDMLKKSVGEEHADIARCLQSLAGIYHARRDYARAEPLLRQALAIRRTHLALTSCIQSERQQLRMAEVGRETLDGYLALAVDARLSGDEAYRMALPWKGPVFARQRRLHLLQRQPELAALFSEYESVSSRLASLVFADVDPAKKASRDGQMTALTDQREEIEKELSRRSSDFRREKELDALTPEKLKACLPRDAVLIDFMGYTHTSPGERKKTGEKHAERRLLAFVVRPEDPVAMIDLGPLEPLEDAIDAWRSDIAGESSRSPRPGASAEAPRNGSSPQQAMSQEEASRALTKRLLDPLRGYLEGKRLLLVSPDGALGRFPLGVLGGREPGRFLLEEMSVALVPFPQELPSMLEAGTGSDRAAAAEQKRGDRAQSRSASSLLLVGDVDYGSDPGGDRANTKEGKVDAVASRAPRDGHAIGRPPPGGARLEFLPLDSTQTELRAVAEAFRKAFADAPTRTLKGADATEAAVREAAPRCRFIHLATHGFFAPASVKSALSALPVGAEADAGGRSGPTGWNPGVLSGIALAGANRLREGEGDDGILTAVELAPLDLGSTELVVFSACETGLGATAGGEGLLGLQRAAQVAGVRTVVASLWKVDDLETQILMARFYDNLWKKGTSKIEALRDAQLSMLRDAQGRALAQGPGRGPGELRDRPAGERRPAPAAAWAAWVLSGDWR
jgi:tetratricopeptide (TPR) repeat protein/CHAT domain-containing protein